MVLPHEIYIDQLALPLGGCPLWGSLHPEMDPVDIGDVGYLSDDGGWIKLFNLRTETNSKNLPPNYRHDSLVVADEDIENDIFKGPRCSSSVSVAGGSVKVKANNIGNRANASLSYECKEEKGAVLFVADDAVARNARNKVPFLQVIKDNIRNWMDFAKQKGRNIQMSDLVLVTGYVRTTTWAAAVFTQKSQSCQFTVGGAFPVGNTGVKLKLWGSLHHVNTSAWTGGPEDKMKSGGLSMTHVVENTAPGKSRRGLLRRNDPRHQCVLVRGYRMADRYFFSSAKRRQGIEVVKRPSPLIYVGEVDNEEQSVFVIPDHHADPAAPNLLGLTTIPDNMKTDQKARLKKLRRQSKTVREEPGDNNSDQNGNNGDKRSDGGAGAGSSSGGNLGNTHTRSQSGSGGSAGSGGQTSKGTSKSGGQTESGRKRASINCDTTMIESNQNDLLSPLGTSTESLGDSQSDISEYSSGDVLRSSVAETVLSPWEILLRYILENEEGADYAIVHDDDFSVLPMQLKSASEFRDELQALKPRIYLNGSIGMLEPTALQFIDNPKGPDFYQTDITGSNISFQESTVSTYDTLSPSPSCKLYTQIPLPKEPQNVI